NDENPPDRDSETSRSRETDRGDTGGRSLYRHPLAAVGGALILAGFFALVVLVAVDLSTRASNPYRSLITFVAAPAVILIGVIVFLVGVRVQIARARSSGEKVRFHLRVEPTDPHFRRHLWLFAGLSLSFVAVVAYSGFQAFEATDSVTFCADTCHTPMEPQAVAHQESAHARVDCVECHIGSGGTSWAKAKVNGIRQLWAVLTGEFDRPIHSPAATLRGADELCEGCHWSEDFKGQKFIDATHYLTDEANSPWTVSLLVNVGGGPEDGVREGIHWHMFEKNKMEYIATDDQRQEIAWVRVTDPDGTSVVYADPQGAPDPADPNIEVRSFDCLDCHNRPSHVFESPGHLMDLEMARALINPDLPFIKRVGLDLLNAAYQTKEEGVTAIRTGLFDYYEANYPEQAEESRADLEAAADALVDIYKTNFFPEMNSDYRVRFNNASHFVSDGCFRCHFSDLETDGGNQISASCETCHVIVGQGPSDDPSELTTNLGGLEFRHPVDIGRIWQQIPCTQCHSPYSGY
ncbi:MAG: NapC/NirT family cytochrome c, partial [Acidimicrobiia bacterium]|nr:NapC/NirT family cytochrome c [Acidimicrobiia bacterium]